MDAGEEVKFGSFGGCQDARHEVWEDRGTAQVCLRFSCWGGELRVASWRRKKKKKKKGKGADEHSGEEQHQGCLLIRRVHRGESL